MEEKEKDMLLKDLCTRIKFNTKVLLGNAEVVNLVGVCDNSVIVRDSNGTTMLTNVTNVKPFLREIDDMTDEEYNEICVLYNLNEYDKKIYITVSRYMNFFIANHFDYNGLIRKELAIKTKLGEIYK